MKKNIFTVMALFAMCGLFAACEPEPKPDHTDPSFLVGTWSNAAKGIDFTIEYDYTFVCNLATIPFINSSAQVEGRLDASGKKLGPNDYFMRDMTTPVVNAANPNYAGNESIRGTVEAFSANNLVGTLKPSADKTSFTFSSKDSLADGFFGGIYTKE